MPDGNYHVDGGIATPAPTTPDDNLGGACRIIISPVSKGRPFFSARNDNVMRISPDDYSWRLLPISNLSFRGGFDVKPSIQNLRAMRMASGIVSSKELDTYYQQGVDDAIKMLKKLE